MESEFVTNWTGRRGHTARLTVVGTPPSTDLAKDMTEIELGLDTIVDLMSRASGPALFRAGKTVPAGWIDWRLNRVHRLSGTT
jgi:hypothetical protein